MRKILFLPLMVMFALVSSCSSDDDEGVTPPEIKEFTCGIGNVLNISFNTFDSWELKANADWCLLATDSVTFGNSVNGEAGVCNVQIKVEDTAVEGDYAELTLTMGGESYVIATVRPVDNSMRFNGKLSVLALNADEFFELEGVKCKLSFNEATEFLDLYLYGVKFDEKMPITIDIKLENLPYTSDESGLRFRLDEDFVPLVRLGDDFLPMDAYSFSCIDGTLANGVLGFKSEMTRGTFMFEGSVADE